MFRRKFIDKLKSRYLETGGMYDQTGQYQQGGAKVLNKVSKELEKASKMHKAQSVKIADLVDHIDKKQTGGVALPGGIAEPIPGSDAIEFSGATHNEGGIMMDPQTEVEDGETMDQVTMAKHGGKRKDYFFSSYLKKGGMSFADMHKQILQKGGTQKDINILARMQEVAAGRDPKKIAKTGGMKNKYQSGGLSDSQVWDVFGGPPTALDVNLAPSLYASNTQPQFNIDQPDLYTVSDDTRPPVTSPPSPPPSDMQRDYANYTANPGNDPYIDISAGDLTFEEYKKLRSQVADPNDPKVIAANKKADKEFDEYINTRNADLALREELWEKTRKGAVPTAAYVAGAAQAIPALYSFLHKQPPAEQSSYTPGFTSPVVADTLKTRKLERVNYNAQRSALNAGIRGGMKFIETSGGGPADIANMQALMSKNIAGQMQIDAAETKANNAIKNAEAQLAQQAEMDNVKRAQAASQFNAQMGRAEFARKDQIDALNAAARQKVKDDEEYMKYQGLAALASGMAGLTGDVLSYQGQERYAKAIGSEGIYQRDVMRNYLSREANRTGIPGVCEAGNCTTEQINKYISDTYNLKS
tara:strand:- start:764 stop:2518 length:1755 start_codon:yes stop_codon:yes gene_type:complete